MIVALIVTYRILLFVSPADYSCWPKTEASSFAPTCPDSRQSPGTVARHACWGKLGDAAFLPMGILNLCRLERADGNCSGLWALSSLGSPCSGYRFRSGFPGFCSRLPQKQEPVFRRTSALVTEDSHCGT